MKITFKALKSKWQNPDPRVRLEAVQALQSTKIELLSNIAISDERKDIRQAALEKISDCTKLRALSTETDDEKVQAEINNRLASLLLSKLTEANDLAAKHDALAAIDSEDLLAEVITREDDRQIRLMALQRISSQPILGRLIEKNCGKETALAALEKINDENFLARAAEHASNRAVRARAREKIAAGSAKHNQPEQKGAPDEKLAELLDEVKQSAASADPDKAWQDFNNLLSRWQKLTPPADHPLSAEFAELGKKINARHQAFNSYKNKTEEENAALDAGLRRLGEIIQAIKALCSSLDEKAPTQAAELQAEWLQINANQQKLAVPQNIHEQYKQVIHNFNDNRLLINTEKAALAELMETLASAASLLQNDKLQETSEALNDLQAKINAWQPLFLQSTELSKRLSELKHQYDQKVKIRDEEGKAVRDRNISRCLAMLDELQNMLSAPNLEIAAKRVAEITEAWGHTIELPDDAQEINAKFNQLLFQFRKRQDDFFRLRDWQIWQNKTLKETLIKQIRQLDDENDLHLVYKKIREVRKKWREIGPVPAHEANRLWAEFKLAADHNFSRCQEFFRKLDEEGIVNLGKKLALCRQAEALQDSVEWRKSAELLKDMQKQWQKIGRSPKGREKDIYSAFRESCDHFFTRRKKHYQELERQRLDNLNQKEELCRQAEELSAAPKLEYKKKFQELQAKWKTIGHTPKDRSDVVLQRFRDASETYYQWLDNLRPQNLAQKEALCEEVENLVSSIDRHTNYQKMANQIINLQKQWQTIGPAPAGQHEAIWRRFRKSCDAFFRVRKNYFAQMDRDRPGNEYLKEKVLKRLHELAGQNGRQVAREIIKLQEEWPQIGQAGKEKDSLMERRFNEACNIFFKNSRKIFQETDRARRENLKHKEALCLRLELLTGINRSTSTRQIRGSQTLTLAEQLKLAFETNFVMAGAGSAREAGRHKKDEFELINHEWQKIGPVPKEHEHAINRRYQAALEAYNKSKVLKK